MTGGKGKIKGAHYILDFYGCDPYQINSLKFWQKELEESVDSAGLEVLHAHFHEFEPQGVTGYILLSTSHVSIHSWPEYNYVACDVFSCSRDKETALVVKHLKKKIRHEKCHSTKIKRGYVTMEYLMSPVYSTGKKEKIVIKEKLADVNSGLQKIMIIDTHRFGKSMVIDGLVQTSEKDHSIYDKAILTKLDSNDRNILILGGGDGYVAEMALKINPKIKITVVDLDRDVVELSKKHLGQKVFDDKRVKLIVGDALQYMKANARNGNKFDGIVSDLTDNPVGTKGEKEGQIKFYKEIIDLSSKNLKKGGWMSFQAGASVVVKKYMDSAKLLTDLLLKKFSEVDRRDVQIPSFSEKNAFLFVKNDNI